MISGVKITDDMLIIPLSEVNTLVKELQYCAEEAEDHNSDQGITMACDTKPFITMVVSPHIKNVMDEISDTIDNKLKKP